MKRKANSESLEIPMNMSSDTSSSLMTSLVGRLRNTKLPKSHGLMPLFEAVVNSIHASEDGDRNVRNSYIEIHIERSNQTHIADELDEDNTITTPDISGFKIIDTGIGFNDDNFESFRTLDSCHKVSKGCRGIGRLLWLKAFESVHVCSFFKDESQQICKREFDFSRHGITNPIEEIVEDETQPLQTVIELKHFIPHYRNSTVKESHAIANALLEHCLWYFIREAGVPQIGIIDGDKTILLSDVYENYQASKAEKREFEIGDESFEITHLKLHTALSKKHQIAYSANSRLVKVENLDIPGLYGHLVCSESENEFTYMGFVSSQYLDESVNQERTNFAIEEDIKNQLFDKDISLKDIRNAISEQVKVYLESYLKQNHEKLEHRIREFVDKRSPRYRPILKRVKFDNLKLSLNASDKDVELELHKNLAEFEYEILKEGHDLLCPSNIANIEEYKAKVSDYLSKATEIKQSDLAGYVSHRRVILDLLKMAIKRLNTGKYENESLIHQLIMPMRVESAEVKQNDNNLWLIDERLAFHHFLASDKTLKSASSTGSQETKEPDIFAINIYDNPLLFNDTERLPLASITVIEIKKPMRNDASANTDTDPTSQVLDYLEKIRNGKVLTATGRPIPDSESIPGFCYVICDITPSIQKCCNKANLSPTSDKMGFFGYNANYRAYIEVLSYDRLVNAAEERNKAFFDQLGFPSVE